MKILVDTNIILDALASRKPFAGDAEKIFLLAAREEVEAYISASSITDIYYILKKYSSEDSSRQSIFRLCQIFKELSVSAAECIDALESGIPDYEDALQEACARGAHMDGILTRDETFLKYSALALSPANFFARTGL